MTGGPAPFPSVPPQISAPPSAPPYLYAYPPPVYAQPYPWPVVAPPPRRRGRWGWVAAALSILTVTVGGVVVLWPGQSGPAVVWHLAGNLAAPPPADASPSTWSAWARQAVDTTV